MNFLSKIKNFSYNILKKENIYLFVLITIIFIFDRLSKLKIISEFSESSYFVNDFINFDLVWNIGVGFGFFSTNSNIIYNFITAIIAFVIIILLYIFVTSRTLDKVIYATIIGGALGNFYDRLNYKAVPDFIDMHYNDFHWFTFNVADIFITVGIILFIVKSFFVKN
tara:strand:+ start:756 stop:1256 length:501 start_codon:yes stop_codon:yes gene_type:complete